MSREGIPTWFFSVVAVRKQDRFLLVHERSHDWYYPAGRAESGETLAQTALRETLEETGIPVVLEGVLRIEHTPAEEFSRVRVIFLARPKDQSPPKAEPDGESLGAGWFTLEELKKLPLRGQEVVELFEYIEKKPPVMPLELITGEHEDFPRHLCDLT